jgi:plasmid replication initiation protein
MRKNLAVISNDLILRSQYKLSAANQKIILYLVSLVKPEQKNFHEVIVPITDLINVLANGKKRGSAYKELRNLVQDFRGRGISFDEDFVIEGEAYTLPSWVVWFQSIRLIKNKEGHLAYEFLFTQPLKSFLLELKRNFTKYDLEEVVELRSPNTIRLYKILKAHKDRQSSQSNIAKITYSLAELKKKMVLDKEKSYKRFSNFKQRVLDTAQRQISYNTRLNFSIETKKIGRKVDSIVFTIWDEEPEKKTSKTQQAELPFKESKSIIDKSLDFRGIEKKLYQEGIRPQKKVIEMYSKGFNLIKNEELRNEAIEQYNKNKDLYFQSKIDLAIIESKKNKIGFNKTGYLIKAIEQNYRTHNLDAERKKNQVKEKYIKRKEEEKLISEKRKTLERMFWEFKKRKTDELLNKYPKLLMQALVTLDIDYELGKERELYESKKFAPYRGKVIREIMIRFEEEYIETKKLFEPKFKELKIPFKWI